MMKVRVASYIGFCFGVKRAVSIAEDLLARVKRAYIVGDLIHNPLEMKRLEKKGLIKVQSVDEIPDGAFVLIRSHGLPKKMIDLLKEKGNKIVDTTCPFVKEVQKKARFLLDKGYKVVILGDPEHPEVKGVLGGIEDKGFVAINSKDLDFISPSDKIGLVSQTTQGIETFIEMLTEICRRGGEVWAFNTICDETLRRRQAVRDIAVRSEAVLIIGGKNSANTRKLVEIVKELSKKVYHIESLSEISGRWFEGVRTLGVASGASTPYWQIKATLAILRKYGGEVSNGNGPDSRGSNVSH